MLIKSIKLVFFIILASCIFGCSGGKMELYKQSDIINLEVTKTDTSLIVFKYLPLLETLYFSPGANLVEAADGTTVELVRCSIKSKCHVTNPAKQDSTGALTFTIENKGQSVFIAYKDGKIRVYPK